MAEYHFRRALSINAVSSVLRCYLSMALHSQNDDIKSSEALDILIQACKVDPKNPQVKNIQEIFFVPLIFLFFFIKKRTFFFRFDDFFFLPLSLSVFYCYLPLL